MPVRIPQKKNPAVDNNTDDLKMCWSEEVSFTSFAVGTVLNVACYWYLWCEKAPVRHQIVWWQYALCMQIPEGIAWRAIEDGNDSALLTASRLAMVLNVTQPLVLFMSVCVAYGPPRIYVLIAVFYYILVMSVEAGDIAKHSEDISPSEGCSHLNLDYWDDTRALVYVFTPLFIFSSIPSAVWSLTNAGIFSVSLIIAHAGFSCGVASMWCWLIVSAGPCVVFVQMYGCARFGGDFDKTPLEMLPQYMAKYTRTLIKG